MKERQFRSSDAVKSISFQWSVMALPWSLIPGKFDLKINQSMKTPWQKYSEVACSYSSAPEMIYYSLCKGWNKQSWILCFLGTQSLGVQKICPSVWKGFWATLKLWLAKILFMGSCNATTVQANRRTSSRNLIHWSVMQRSNWLATVQKESFWVAIVL